MYQDFLGRDYKSILGFHVGGLVEIPISKKIAVQSELLFSKQGTKYSFNSNDFSPDVDFEINYSYLNLPVMIKLYIAKGFSLQTGLQIGFLINAKETIEINDESRSTDLENIKTLDFGVNFGVGYQLKLNIFLRYVIT